MFKTIWDKLYTLLSWLTTTTKLNKIYNYERKISDEWFPIATISPNNTNEEIFDNVNDIVNISYMIRIYNQNKNISTTEWDIRKLVDDVLVAIRWDYTLTWSAVSMNMTISWWYNTDEQPIRIAEIIVNYKVLISYQ